MFLISLDFILWTSIDLIKENGFTLKKARSTQYLTETMMDVDNRDDGPLLTNTPAKAKSLLHSLEQTAGNIGLCENTNKTESMHFKQEGTISTLSDKHLKLVDLFTHADSYISSAESDINMCLTKAWTVIDQLLILLKLGLSVKINCFFSPVVDVSVLLYGCTTWMLTNHMEKKLGENYIRMQHAILSESNK